MAKNMKTVTPETIGSCRDGDEVRITAALAEVSVKETRSGERMAIARIDAAGGPVEVVIFPDAYREAAAWLRKDAQVTFEGSIDDPRPEHALKLKVVRITD